MRFTVTCSHSNRSGEVSLSNDKQSTNQQVSCTFMMVGGRINLEKWFEFEFLVNFANCWTRLKQLAACQERENLTTEVKRCQEDSRMVNYSVFTHVLTPCTEYCTLMYPF